MTGPGEPRGRKRRTREPDFAIDPNKPNATIELETADLLNLQQSGLVQGLPNKTRELALADLEELREGQALEPEPKVFVDLGPDPDAPAEVQTVFVDLGAGAAAPVAVAPVAAPAVVIPGAVAPVAVPPAPAPPQAARPGTPINVQRVTPTMPRMHRASSQVPSPRASSQMTAARARGGMGLVVLVYVLAISALAISVYFRFVA